LKKDVVLEVVAKIFELVDKLLPLDVGEKQVVENLMQTLVIMKVLMLGV